jgi:hypothetical protein
LFKASIFYIFIPPPNLTGPHDNRIPPPLHSTAVIHPLPSLAHHFRVHLVGCRVVLSIGGRLKPRQIFLYSFFCPKSDGQKDFTASSSISTALCAVSIPTLRLTFSWLLRPPIQQEPLNCKAPLPSLILFFCCSICHQNRWVRALPHVFLLFASPLQNSPHHNDTIVKLAVSYIHREAATQVNFSMGTISAPKQRDQTQRTQTRTPGASIRLIGSHSAAIQVHGGCCHGE